MASVEDFLFVGAGFGYGPLVKRRVREAAPYDSISEIICRGRVNDPPVLSFYPVGGDAHIGPNATMRYMF